MIVFLNGSINAGKSTVAKLLAKEMPNSALVEVDSLSAMIDWMPIDRSVPINLENAVAIIQNFVKRGLNVIVPYPLSQKNYEYMTAHLNDCDADIFVFTLAPSIEKAQSDTQDRKLTEWERERIKHHYDIGIPNPTFGKIVDTTNQTPEETAAYIIAELALKQVPVPCCFRR